MQWLCLGIFLLLVCGIVMILHLRFSDLWKPVFHRRQVTLRDELDVLVGKPQRGYFRKEFYATEQILRVTGREGKFETVKRLAVLLFALGVCFAVLLQNMFLVPVMAVGLALIPFWYIRASAAKYKRQLHEDLEASVSIITTSYLRSEDIVGAVKENLPYISPYIRSHFKNFIAETELINANIISALNTLKLRVPNAIFHEWCNTLIACQSDRNAKHTLVHTIRKFSDMRQVQAELDTMLSAPRREAVTMIFLVLSNIPLLYVLNRDWFYNLVFTPAGKIALAICAGIIVLSMARIMKLSQPLEYRG